MDARKYKNGYGKLNQVMAIPVDQKLKRIEMEAKKKRFEFNKWARDILYSRMHEVVDACDIEAEEEPE